VEIDSGGFADFRRNSQKSCRILPQSPKMPKGQKGHEGRKGDCPARNWDEVAIFDQLRKNLFSKIRKNPANFAGLFLLADG
jgi:hypothetical protein